MKTKLFSYLGRLEGNSRVCLSLFPLWIVPYTLYIFYLSLYLQHYGLSEIQIGNIMIVANVGGLFCALIASPLVDRMGRKWATSIFDFISSVLPPLLFLFFPGYPAAICAMALSSLNRIMTVGYYLLLIEDRPESNGVTAVNIFNLLMVLAGALIPLAGLVVSGMGLISAERLFLLVSVLSMTVMTIIRHNLLKETPTGLAIKERLRKMGSKPSVTLAGYRPVLGYIVQNPRVRSAVLVNALVYVYYTVGTTASLFFVPYFTKFLGLSDGEVALVGGVYAAGTVLAMVGINPRLNRQNMAGFTIAASIGSLAGFFLLIICPHGALIPALGGTALAAISYGVLKTIGDALLALETGGEYRTGVYALSTFISSLVSIAVIRICSFLYGWFPGWLFIITGLLIVVILINGVLRLGDIKKAAGDLPAA
ncbi:MAG: MFS transporter [Treponema sp.]|nr:MFS transporter [Treponema sp.]